MIKKIAKYLILIAGFFIIVVTFPLYMVTISNPGEYPYTVEDILVLHSFLFVGSLLITVGLMVIQNLLVRGIVAVIFMLLAWLFIDFFTYESKQPESGRLDGVLIQFDYVVILHLSFLSLFALFVIVKEHRYQIKQAILNWRN